MPRGNELLLSEVGEVGIIEAISRIIAASDPNVVVGIGDDAAVLQTPADRYVLVTTDIQVAGIHFQPVYATAYDVGWKVMAVNLSDIAAMGGVPRYAVLSLAVLPDLELRWVEDLYRGLEALGRTFGVAIVGGNLARTPGPITVDATVLGEVEPDLVVRRQGARAGDRLLVSGALGASAAGYTVLKRGLPRASGDTLVAAHLRPQPRVHEGRVAARSRWVTAMIDLSDGLATDLWRLCEANGLGVRIDGAAVPLDAAACQVAGHIGVDPLDLAMFGEDYELLIAASPTHAEGLVDLLRDEVGTTATIIGEFVNLAEGRQIKRQAEWLPLRPEGWDHFLREIDSPGSLAGSGQG